MSNCSKSNSRDKNSQKGKKPFNKNNNSKRNGRREEQNDDKRITSLDRAGRDNDPNWYIRDPKLAEEVCKLSFNSFIGEGVVAGTQYALPSVVRYTCAPSPFNSYDIQDASSYTYIKRSGLNLAITKLYTLLASYSGRAANYAPQDVGTLILAMGEIVSMVEDLRRVVGISYTFSERNRALPKLLFHALGYDYDDFIKNRALYIDRLNAIITRFNSLPILGNIAYIIKCRDMYQKVYADSPSPEATLLVMVPQITWCLDESTYSGGTILKTFLWTQLDSYDTFKRHLDTLETMVEALFGSTTLNTIYADLLNLASKVKVDMFKLDYVTSDYIVLPEYNANFLLQLHNADILGWPVGTSFDTLWDNMKYTPSNDVYPDPNNNSLIYNPIWKYNISSPNSIHYMTLVDLPEADPSVENIIESTRFKATAAAQYTLGQDYVTAYSNLPDHYIMKCNVWTKDDVADTTRSLSSNWITAQTLPVATILSILSSHSQEDWAPIIYYQNYNAGNAVQYLYGDMNYFTQISPATLQAMNRIIAQDLFDFRM